MYPYSVETDNSVDLFQLSDGRFQMTKQGPLVSFLVGYKYVLMEKSLVEVFERIGIQGASFNPVVIFNRKLNTEILDYYELSTDFHFVSEEVGSLKLSGLIFLVMDERYLFVSPGLKKEIEETSINWSFTYGLGNFA